MRALRHLLTGLAAAAVVASALLVAPPAAADQVRNLEYWLDDYGIREAWSVTRGAGSTIAIIDTGVDADHPDLRGAVAGGADFSGAGAADGTAPVGADGSAHGTMVASLAAGRGTGAADGVIGVAPEAQLLSLSIGFGEGDLSDDDQIAAAVRWAVDHGADVINMSFTRNTLDWPRSWDDAFLYAMEHDVVLVAAAGNRGSGSQSVGAPATMPGVLTVAGVDRHRAASWDASAQGITIGVAAPSEDLVGAAPGGGYVTWSGTSGAAPLVAGLAALVRAAHPELDAANVIQRVVATATDAGEPGADPVYGHGLIDAAAAVSAPVAAVTENPMGDLREWIRVHRPAAPTPEPSAPAEPVQPPQADEDPLGGSPAVDPEPREEGVLALFTDVNRFRLQGLPLVVLGAFGLGFIAVVAVAAVTVSRARRGE